MGNGICQVSVRNNRQVPVHQNLMLKASFINSDKHNGFVKPC